MSIQHRIREYLEEFISPDLLTLEIPPDPKLGDFAVPCFPLAKELKKAPQQIAEDLAGRIEPKEPIDRIEAAGPYLNLFLDRGWVAQHVLAADIAPTSDQGKLLFEYPSPNTNKPLHLGHVRNMLLGATAATICERAGAEVLRTNLYNDRGVHICKSMLAYMRWGENRTPEDMGLKGDHFVGHWYVEFARRVADDPSLEEEAQELLRQWEERDPVIMDLWAKMNHWAYEGFKETFAELGISFDKVYYESDYYDKAKDLVLGQQGAVFSLDEKENFVIDLEDENLGKPVVLRADGTSVYMTQDLYLAQLRQEELTPDAQIYVVGEEQTYRFRQLFAILRRLDFPHAENLHHLAYGLISLPEGKMKSREGKVVDADDLLAEMQALAAKEVLKRHPELAEEEVERRAKAIGYGALRFYVLKYEPKTNFTYDPEESIAFEGETGPYIQYSIARINSILRQHRVFTEVDVTVLQADEEYALLTLLRDTASVVEEAARTYRPHLVARHAMAVAQGFTAFYHACRVLDADPERRDARIRLLEKTKTHLSYLLDLLGIETLEEM